MWNEKARVLIYAGSESGRISITMHRERSWPYSRWRGFSSEVGTSRLSPHSYGVVEHRLVGVSWSRTHDLKSSGTSYALRVPHAYVVGLAALLPAVGLPGWVGRKRRMRNGLCVACGYDLRATPARCPECGLLSAAPAAPGRLRSRWGQMRPARRWALVGVAAGLAGLGWWGAWHLYLAPAISIRTRAEINYERRSVHFYDPPDAASLRYIARLPGQWELWLSGLKDAAPFAPEVLRRVDLRNVVCVGMIDVRPVHPWLSEIIRGGSDVSELNLAYTDLGDEGLKELAGQNNALKNVRQLSIWGTGVTDAGLKELARADTSLSNLRTLHVGMTRVGDEGLRELARPDTGLKKLIALYLWHTRVTDKGLKELARPDTGLGSLSFLSLEETAVTAAGLRELARPDSGLASLTSLNLDETSIDNEGLVELARPDSGLKALVRLKLYRTHVTDEGLMELARPDSGLGALEELDLVGTRVTPVGVAAVRKARPGLKLHLSPSAIAPRGAE